MSLELVGFWAPRTIRAEEAEGGDASVDGYLLHRLQSLRADQEQLDAICLPAKASHIRHGDWYWPNGPCPPLEFT